MSHVCCYESLADWTIENLGVLQQRRERVILEITSYSVSRMPEVDENAATALPDQVINGDCIRPNVS
jgi:hypothetical protein